MNAKEARRIALTSLLDLIYQERNSPTGVTWGYIRNEPDHPKVLSQLDLIKEEIERRLDAHYGGRFDQYDLGD